MKKKILHWLSSNRYSGAENVAISIIRHLSNEYEFAYMSPAGPIERILLENGIKYFPLNKPSFRDAEAVLKSWKPDLIHAHDFRASIDSARSRYRCTRISHIHQNPPWIKGINPKTWVYLLSCMRTQGVILVSPQILREASFAKLIRDKVTVLSNFVDTQRVVRESKFEDNCKSYDLLFVGRLTEVKDPVFFLSIVKELRRTIPNIQAALVGGGKLLEYCKLASLEMGIHKNVDIYGELRNPFPIMANSRLLLITSKYEGFGLVAVEAMALGKPVIAKPVGGLIDIIDGTNGELCSDTGQFVAAITRALMDPKYYSYMSNNAMLTASRYADVHQWKSILRSIYEGALAERNNGTNGW